MSRLKELIDELCPDGVVFRDLKSLTTKPKSIKWKDEDGERQYIDLASVDIASHRILETIGVNRESAPSRARQIVKHQDVLFATTRPTQMRYCLIPDEYDEQICSTGFCVLRVSSGILDPRYLCHTIGSDSFRSYVEANQTQGNYPAVSDAIVRDYRIPVPPIEVQREIVRILDAMQELEETLASELDERQTQFDSAIAKRLSEEGINRAAGEAVPFVAVKDVREEVITPVRAKPTDFSGEIPWCKLEDVEGFSLRRSLSGKGVSTETIETMGLKIYPKGTVLCSCSATLGKYCIVETPLVTNQRFMGFVCKKGVLNRYFMYAVKAGTTALVREATGTTNPYISRAAFESLMIQMPSLDVQLRIADELDTMYELINHIEEELRMRRLQFEYYRDKLLDFPEKAV